MRDPSRWLRGARSLPVLLGVIVAVPAMTLIVLGLWLFDQDRDLARRRRVEQLGSAADRAVRTIERDLGELTRRLSNPAWHPEELADGSIVVTVDDTEVHTQPGSAIAWYPRTPSLAEPPQQSFAELDAAACRSGDLAHALEISRRLAARAEPPIRAFALLRQAAVLRKMQRTSDAAVLYRQLSDVQTIAINGEPIGLVARRTLCELSTEDRRRSVAMDLQADLGGGRWRLDRVTYDYVSSQLDSWLGSDRTRNSGGEALAAGVEWLARQRTTGDGLSSTGYRELPTEAGPPVTIVWAASPARVTAMVALPAFVDRVWREAASTEASPATISFERAGDKRTKSEVPAGAAVRTSLQTGLPWTIVATFAPGTAPDDLPGRERTLVAALVAVLTLAGAGAFVVFRMRHQEIALSRLQSDFVSAVSHEFRTPLTALRQFNDLLAEDTALPIDKQREYHRGQTRATERLSRLVESVLDFGRMEAGRRPYAFQPVDAGALVRDLVEEFRHEIDGRGFTLRYDAGAGSYPIQADPEAFGLALWNLLDNAVKYSGDSRNVEVSVNEHAARPTSADRAIAISVRDYGMGIPADDRQRIFQRFVRGEHATGARIKGTGIGLAMVQHVVSAHRGRIDVASEPGRGSTFTIVIERG